MERLERHGRSRGAALERADDAALTAGVDAGYAGGFSNRPVNL